jgi:hypothetical protein
VRNMPSRGAPSLIRLSGGCTLYRDPCRSGRGLITVFLAAGAPVSAGPILGRTAAGLCWHNYRRLSCVEIFKVAGHTALAALLATSEAHIAPQGC